MNLPSEPDEFRLWQSLCRGEPKALAGLEAWYGDALRAEARRLSSDEVVVRDAVRDVFAALWDEHLTLAIPRDLLGELRERLHLRLEGAPTAETKDSLAVDSACWHRLLRGDVTALEDLMEAHSRLLFRYGRKFSTDADLVKDCIQDLYLDLWERRDHLRPDVRVKPYLMVALRRRIHRQAQRQASLDGTPEPDLLPLVDFSVEEKYIEDEATLTRAQALHALLKSLPTRQKEAVYLRFFEDLDREEIAQTMGVAPQSVSNLLQEALRKLRAQWRIDLALWVVWGAFLS
jgi:RNA polymerase sigma factor (sigma-70 family)